MTDSKEMSEILTTSSNQYSPMRKKIKEKKMAMHFSQKKEKIYVQITEGDIKEILGELNEHSEAGSDIWNVQKLCDHFS